MPTSANGAAHARSAATTRPRLPSSQKTMVGRVSSGSAMYLRADVSAWNSAETTSPASTSTSIEPWPRRPAMNITAATAPMPPAKAEPWMASEPACSSMASAAPKPAPDETPRIAGEASGLRNSVW